MAAKSKIDSPAARQIIATISKGNTLETAAAAGGVAAATVREWLRRGANAMYRHDQTGEYGSGDEPYANFAREFLRGEANIKTALVAVIHDQATDKDGKLALQWYEKRWPHEMGDGKLRKEMEQLLDAVLDELGHEAYERVLARIGGEATRGDPGPTTH